MIVKRNWRGQFIKGERNISFKGGRLVTEFGYVKILKPEHPFNNQGYVLEHRLVMEKKLGRYLDRKEIVHHINHIKDDNREENLMILSRAEHQINHRKGKKLPKEVREKISKANTGHKVSKETIEKIRKAKLKNPTKYWLGKKSVMKRDNKGRFYKSLYKK